jgi:hypothetical protein
LKIQYFPSQNFDIFIKRFFFENIEISDNIMISVEAAKGMDGTSEVAHEIANI